MENLAPVDLDLLLRRLNAMPIAYFTTAGAARPAREIGPSAEAFRAAFGLGHDDKSIAEGDANGIAGMFGKPGEDASKLLENVGYSYFALRAGWEFGGDRFTFFTRAGMTWVSTTIHELDEVIAPEEGSNTTVSISKDPELNAFVPTLQLGMIVQL
jgi:hypothetical protein